MRFSFLLNLAVATTCVFWDVEDFQVPDGVDPASVYQNIEAALANEGYRGTVKIRAYGEKNRTWDGFLLAGIHVVPEGDKCARRDRMMKDVLFWALDNPVRQSVVRSLMVISKNISEDTEFLSVLQGLKERKYNVLLTEYDNVSPVKHHQFVSSVSVWLWTSLLDGGKPVDQSSGSSQRVDKKRKRKKRTTSSGSSKAEETDSEDMKSKSLEV